MIGSSARIESELDAYYAEHQRICLDPEARAAKHSRLSDEQPRRWTVEQTLVDPEELNDWFLKLAIDLDRSDAEARPVLTLDSLAPLH